MFGSKTGEKEQAQVKQHGLSQGRNRNMVQEESGPLVGNEGR